VVVSGGREQVPHPQRQVPHGSGVAGRVGGDAGPEVADRQEPLEDGFFEVFFAEAAALADLGLRS
jgi:hypothetical protein